MYGCMYVCTGVDTDDSGTIEVQEFVSWITGGDNLNNPDNLDNPISLSLSLYQFS